MNEQFDAQTISQSFHQCQELTRSQARNFYYGLRLMPEPRRSAMYAIYAWMRTADDLMDAQGDDATRIARVEQFRDTTRQVIAQPDRLPGDLVDLNAAMWPAVAQTLHQYEVPLQYLDAMIEGQLQDQHVKQYTSFADLHAYCYKVASVVGLICIHIWGYQGGRETEQLAIDRGIALQLTNILRDLREDAQRGRFYLPQEDLQRFGVLPEQILQGRPDQAFLDLMTFQIQRAEDYYRQSLPLEQFVDPACRPTCWAMMRIYHRLLDRIRRNPARVLEERIRLRKRQKMMIALHATWKRTWGS